MKILITGAAGDVGAKVTIALLEKGHQVKALVRRVESAGWLKKAGAEIHIGDVTKPETLIGICDDVDVVYHFSAVLWVSNLKKTLKEVNYFGTVNLAKECLGKKVKCFIFPSFPLVLGPHEKPLKELRPEEAPANPNSYHALSKKLAEEFLLKLSDEGKLPVTILRLGTIYGPNTRLIKSLSGLMRKGLFRLAGGGKNIIHFIHIDDVVQAMSLAMEKDVAAGQIYNICDDRPVTMREFANLLADTIGVKRPGTAPVFFFRIAAFFATLLSRITGKPALTNQDVVTLSISSCVADTSKAKKELGFQPKYPTVYEGMKAI
jgi:nucleoside-diphosphate-sugar epimerase